MPDISKITLPSGTTYDIKDTVARTAIGGAIKIKGTTTTALTDGATTNPITINDDSYTAVANDAVFYGNAEFVFDGTNWHEFGDMSGIGDMGKVDTGKVTITPAGTNSSSAVTFTGGGSDSVLGADTTFNSLPSAVTFTGESRATALTSSVTATVPKTSSTTKYITAASSLGTETSTRGDNTPMWGASVANETLSFTFKPISTALSSADSTSTGAVPYVSAVSTSGTDSVTFDTSTSGNTASVVTNIGTGTAAAQSITAATNDLVTAVTNIGTGTAAAQLFSGTEHTWDVYPNNE